MQTLSEKGAEAFDLEGGLRLVSWNLAKRPLNETPLAELAGQTDILCVQEATPELLPLEGNTVHFAESFRTPGQAGQSHGLATLARAHPLAEGSHVIHSRWKEGWVMTPKMVLSSEFDLGATRLLIINVHAYNFQPVFKYMLRDQFERIARRVDEHVGPAVVCGDFNTWRRDRFELVQRFLPDFDPVQFAPSPHRKCAHWSSSLALGSPQLALDHVFVRGMEWSNAHVLPCFHSDHGALAVQLHPVSS